MKSVMREKLGWRDPSEKLELLFMRRIQELLDHRQAERVQLSTLYGGPVDEDFARFLGFCPLINPRNGRRYGEEGFEPYWSSLLNHDGVFELNVQFAEGAFTTRLLIDDHEGVDARLLAMCREFATPLGTWKTGTLESCHGHDGAQQ